ncbi:MAG: hypothetical protein AABY97_07865 [Chloroflexota bacterium]
MDAEAKRVRAWVFFKVEDAGEAARKIAVHFREGGDDWIIVRADVVEGDPNLVVPVDAASDDQFKAVLEILRKEVGAEKSYGLVKNHYPDPAHKAYCFVTPGEHGRHRDPAYDPPGRHPKSPGGNAWG